MFDGWVSFLVGIAGNKIEVRYFFVQGVPLFIQI